MTTPAVGILDTARTRDGLELHTVRWPALGSVRALLLLVHGIAEHADRHAHVAAFFARAGIETHAYDLRGFGRSTGSRAFLDRWSRYHDDVEDRLAAAHASAGGQPVILYGHSMGGLIAVGYTLADPPRPQPDLLVLSAPAIAANIPGWKLIVAELLGRVLPRLAIANELPPGGLSRDPQVEIAYRSDPLNVHHTTARLGLELFHEQTRVQARLSRLDALPLPTYVMHGADDPIVPARASALLDGKKNVTRRVYPGLRHEMHNEPEAAAVIGDTIAWIDRALR